VASETRTVTSQYEHNTPVALDIWHEAASAINSGSYAVLVAIAVVYVLTRKAIGKALEHHFQLLESLKDATARNSQSIRIMAVTHRRLADYYTHNADSPGSHAVLSILKSSGDAYEQQQKD
jgi:ABC-type protease/lipase transport system fused ATPase/permease subunit